MAVKKTAPKKKKSAARIFEQTDLALCLAAIFATLSVVFVAITLAKYL